MNLINARVYVVCMMDGKILALFEKYAGESLLKLPGGGLEFGEGTVDCLHREMDEELNLRIENVRHFYTQEDFVESRFGGAQLLTIYYSADIVNINELFLKDKSIERVEWIPISGDNPFTLPVDRIIFEKLKKEKLNV